MAITVSNNKPTIFPNFIFSGQNIYINQNSDFNGQNLVYQSILYSCR
jgi:hypothetical protein